MVDGLHLEDWKREGFYRGVDGGGSECWTAG
jgi:hypothetical protein